MDGHGNGHDDTERAGAEPWQVHNAVSGGSAIHGPVFQSAVTKIESLTWGTRTDSGPPPPPRQLPGPSREFVNRRADIANLTAALASSSLVSVSGLGGVGKTQLIAQWGDEVADHRYPDGQLYTDLQDLRRDGAVDVSDVLMDFLMALGVDQERIPATRPGRAGLFRTVTAGRQLLVVVDNVQHAPEVRPLMPSGGHLVVVSRRRLPSLVLDGAVPLTVQPLDGRAGVELVQQWHQTAAQQTAVQLWRLCGGLPLAMRAAGHRLVSRPHLPLEDVVRELADLRGLPAGDGDESLPAVFAHTVADFPDHTRALYRLLGLLPGTTFTAAVAEAAGVRRFDDALDDLLNSHLAVHAPVGHGQNPTGTVTAPSDATPSGPVPADHDLPSALHRYRLHDEAREHARRYVVATEPEARRTVLQDRLIDVHVAFAAHADRAVLGDRLRLQPAPAGATPFSHPKVALQWLDGAGSTLLGVMRLAAERGRHDAVWWLAESLWALYHSRKIYSDWIASHRLAIASAQWDARPDAEIRMRNQLSRAHYDLGDYAQATQEIERAADVLGAVSDRRLHGIVWETRALLCGAQGDHEAAVKLFTRALHANEGDRHGVAMQSYQLGQALVNAGRPERAVQVLDAALAQAPEGDAVRMRIGIVLGRAHQALGDPDRAVAYAVDAAAQASERAQYAKLEQALTLVEKLAQQVGDGRLRQVCLDRIEELRQRPGSGQAGGS